MHSGNREAAGLGLRGVVYGVLVLCALAGGQAQAQDHFNAETFQPAPQAPGSVLSVYGSHALSPGRYALSLLASYGRKPLGADSSNSSNRVADLVGSIGTLQLLGAIGLFDRVDLGVAVPLHRVAAGSELNASAPASLRAAVVDSTQVALGQVRVVPRVSLLEREESSGFGIALLVPVGLPTGKKSAYVGEPLNVEPRLALDYAFDGGLLAINGGFLIREREHLLGNTIGNMLRGGAGGLFTLAGPVEIMIETNLQTQIGASSGDSSHDSAAEAVLGLRLRKAGWVGQLGAGPGYLLGATAPSLRAFAGIGYSPEPVPLDQDGDGIPDASDRCPAVAEDRDGFQDDDGCPDTDDDQDGVADANDRCPREAEDRDGFEDDDGCPDTDDDRDGLADAVDRCPREAEDRDGFQDDDGCPDTDDDQDGVPDRDDRCPREPGVAEQQGCPPPPPPPPAPVKLTDTQIEIDQQVLFALGSAALDARATPMLDAVAKLLREHAEIKRVHVEGHTDNRGSARVNQKLSSERAKAIVAALIERGVEAQRLDAEGFGSKRPIAPNDNEDGRAKNRRVELHIEH